jgi:hypothetical protein
MREAFALEENNESLAGKGDCGWTLFITAKASRYAPLRINEDDAQRYKTGLVAEQVEKGFFLLCGQAFEHAIEFRFGLALAGDEIAAFRICAGDAVHELLADMVFEHHDDFGIHAAAILLRQRTNLVTQAVGQADDEFFDQRGTFEVFSQLVICRHSFVLVKLGGHDWLPGGALLYEGDGTAIINPFFPGGKLFSGV